MSCDDISIFTIDIDSDVIDNDSTSEFKTTKRIIKSKPKKDYTNVDNIKMEVIDKIIEIFPKLAKRRNDMVDVIIDNKEIKREDYILERAVEVEDEICYRDPFGNILNKDTDVIGAYFVNKGTYYYIMFKNLNNMHNNKCKQTMNHINDLFNRYYKD